MARGAPASAWLEDCNDERAGGGLRNNGISGNVHNNVCINVYNNLCNSGCNNVYNNVYTIALGNLAARPRSKKKPNYESLQL